MLMYMYSMTATLFKRLFSSEQKERVNVHHTTGNVAISMSQKKESSHFQS